MNDLVVASMHTKSLKLENILKRVNTKCCIISPSIYKPIFLKTNQMIYELKFNKETNNDDARGN